MPIDRQSIDRFFPFAGFFVEMCALVFVYAYSFRFIE